MYRYSANISLLYQELPFLERFEAAAAAGFDATECWFPYAHTIKELRAAIGASGIPLISLNTAPGDTSAGEFGLAGVHGRESAFRAALLQAAEYATALEVPNVHVLAGMVTGAAERARGMEIYRDNLERGLEWVAGAPVTLLIEASNAADRPDYLLHRSDEANAIVRETDHPQLRQLFDCYHTQRQEGDVARRVREQLGQIVHIQFAGAPNRGHPAEGELNLPYVFQAAQAAGYTGYLGAEYIPAGPTGDSLDWMQSFATATHGAGGTT
ncbi:MAG: TIM barrel protein [Pseudomonadota bacterium]